MMIDSKLDSTKFEKRNSLHETCFQHILQSYPVNLKEKDFLQESPNF